MARRELTFTDFSQVPDELDRLHRGGYERLGQWDLAQVCDHLTYFARGPIDGWHFKVPWLLKFIFGKMMLKRILNSRSMKSGVPTPQKPLPASGGDEAAAIARLNVAIQDLLAHKGPLHPSPFFGEMSPEQCRELNLIHCAHHLGYLKPK